MFVGAAHIAALWAISRAPAPLEAAAPAPIAASLIESLRPIAEPQPTPHAPVATPAAPRAVKRPVSDSALKRTPKQAPAKAPHEPVEASPSEQADNLPAVAEFPASDSPSPEPQAISNDQPTPPTPPASQPIAIAARFDAAYLNNPAPAYPALARRLGEEGTVRLRVWVTRGGRAGKLELAQSAGSPRLDRAALETVSRWRFEPARENGVAVEQWVIVPIKFKLENHDR